LHKLDQLQNVLNDLLLCEGRASGRWWHTFAMPWLRWEGWAKGWAALAWTGAARRRGSSHNLDRLQNAMGDLKLRELRAACQPLVVAG
jgi:hypothetical protein